jgi:hypothetical protein
MKNDKSEKFAQFTSEYKDFQKWLTRKKFDIWLQKYAVYIDHKYFSGHSGSYKWFMIHEKSFDESKLNEYNNNIAPF